MAITNFSPTQPSNTRLGLHYFPDTLHYREADLQTWLPELQALGVSWLVLRSEHDRAIPEHFLRGLKQAGIRPLIQFAFSLEQMPDLKEIGMLWEVYARWGANHVIFYDRPNGRAAWPVSGWLQQDLVECFLDRYLPAAALALQIGLTPVFPPLEPGGSYWDTAFLRSALQAMQRRKQEELLQRLVLSAYGWTGGHSLNWGAGGPERWPQARPYQLLAGGQDQRGFRIADWYLAIARSVLQQSCSILLLQAGVAASPLAKSGLVVSQEQAATSASLARLLAGEEAADPQAAGSLLEPLPEQLIACNFWLLSAAPGSPHLNQAWFEDSEHRRPVVDEIRTWRRERKAQAPVSSSGDGFAKDSRSIRHYLLLPGYEWGVSDWYLEVIRPFVKKYRPTVGFSPEEAEKAARVTVVGNPQNYPESLLDRLEKSGCQVEQIGGDGTNIATELSVR
ncbi:MAG: hypothetical protein EHM21_05040 [Chloroflexi bacterium]|nr:MAG: hypothetical protein EHM21_05040 [Chloroflexota bacterium]